MQSSSRLTAELRRWLKNARRLAVLGVGNRMLGDDGAGMMAAERLSKAKLSRNVMVVKGGVAPENFTGKIVGFKPTHLLIVDAAVFRAKPGSLRLFTMDEVSGLTFSTHRLPLTLLTDYIKHSLPEVDARLLAVKPGKVGWGLKPTREVSAAVRRAVEALLKSLPEALRKNF